MQGRAEGSDHYRFAEVLSISGSTGVVDVSIQVSDSRCAISQLILFILADFLLVYAALENCPAPFPRAAKKSSMRNVDAEIASVVA